MDVVAVLEFAQEEAAEEEELLRHNHEEGVFEIPIYPLMKYSDRKFVRRYRISKDIFR
jgi:hypothetical protein